MPFALEYFGRCGSSKFTLMLKKPSGLREAFRAEFVSVDVNALTLSKTAVLDESREQVSRSEAVINAFGAGDVNAIKLCVPNLAVQMRYLLQSSGTQWFDE
ncbi:hypothetical protein HJC23_001222 [Cyclotella cryptica]|uniref:Uncharacterized protein n=1 Tax=Cyclotella cryptica TaxID=29204 RepID=A0ABD3QPD8_9STRA